MNTTTAALDIVLDSTPDGRWAFSGATDAGRDYLAMLGAFGATGAMALPVAMAERFIASARAAGLTLGMGADAVAVEAVAEAVAA